MRIFRREPEGRPWEEPSTDQAIAFRVHALLSLQRAMWDMVTPELRCVSIRLVPDTAVALRFVFDHPPTEEEQELVDDIEDEFSGDFPGQVHVQSECQFLPPSLRRELYAGEEWVYLRRER